MHLKPTSAPHLAGESFVGFSFGKVSLPQYMFKRVALYRHISILLISISLMAPVIYCIDYYYNRMLHRLEMWSEAEKGLLQSIEIDSASIHWTKKNRELIINGAYFDVVSISYVKSKAILQGVFDHEETEMHEAFAKKQIHDHTRGNTTQKIANWLQLLWKVEETIAANYFYATHNKAYSISPPYPLTFHTFAPPSPPPWLYNSI